jgi:hypothetical protein
LVCGKILKNGGRMNARFRQEEKMAFLNARLDIQKELAKNGGIDPNNPGGGIASEIPSDPGDEENRTLDDVQEEINGSNKKSMI